jgi:hypothetical protein
MINKPPSSSGPGRFDTLQSVMNAVPSPVFVIDQQARIELVNKCAEGQKHLLHAYTHLERMGNVMGCINALSCTDGCGGARNCRDCPIRKAVGDAAAGKNVFRNQAVFQLRVDGNYTPVHLWITASLLRFDGRDLIVLILEDVDELVKDTGLVPVCESCGKVGVGTEYHESVGAYVKGRFESDRQHDRCPDCEASAN